MVIDTDSPPTNPAGEFEDFLRNYEEVPNEFKYRQRISDAYAKSEHHITVLFEDILTFNPQLAHYLKNHPDEALEEASDAFKNIIRIDAGGFFNPDEVYFIRISTQNNSNEVSLRSIRSVNVDNLIYVRGIIIRVSVVRPQIVQAMFECPICGNLMQVDQMTTKLTPPRECMNPTCNNKKDFKVMTEQSDFIDHQYITIQQAPEDLRSGDIPQTLQCILLHDLVDSVRPGERVKMMGVLKSVPREDRRGRLSTLFQSQLFINSVEGIRQEDEELDLSQEDIDEIHALAQEPDIQKKIARSIARSILGQEHLKMGSALSLFGGVRKVKKDGSKLRGDIHVLFMGDPGTGKSQILQNCAQISPRSVYTSGKGASAAGLTAAVIKDSDNAGLQLEAGALVLASGGVACIDEFEKMRKQDRSAIHEAMEQQSYHPRFELTLNDNSRVLIGDFVDNLFERMPDRKVEGINCEILPIKDLNYEALSTNFEKNVVLPIDRVSRHDAPEFFVEVCYSNGRKILVTPEHPIYIMVNNNIKTLSAEEIEKGQYIPALNLIKFGSENLVPLNLKIEEGRKDVNLPSILTNELSAFLGYFVTEGYSYYGSSAEIGLSNTDPSIIQEMKNLIQSNFGIEAIDYTDKNRALRIISKSIYNFMEVNFPEVMVLSVKKRIPTHIFNSPDHIRISFLETAFKGDGGIESTALAYYTSSPRMAYEYQDLLLSLGIHSRILEELYYFGEDSQESRIRYKIYIRGDSLERFVSLIIGEENLSGKLLKILEKSKKTHRKHDVVPSCVAELILDIKKKIGITNDGYYIQHIQNNYGINRDIVRKELSGFDNKIKSIRSGIEDCLNLLDLRKLVNFSQDKIAKLSGVSRSKIDYLERGGYSNQEKKEIFFLVREKIDQQITDTMKIIEQIEQILKFRWLKIKSVERIPNAGSELAKWVYDVTISPTENFISHGVILHNTISIAKAGIVATLQAKTAIIAAANPKHGRWNDYDTAINNINLSPPILSRFDLIFIVRDIPEKAQDDRIADYILKNHMMGDDEASVYEDDSSGTKSTPKLEDFIPMDLLKKYLQYAKAHSHPKLTHEAVELIRDFYIAMRSSTQDGSTAVPIVARTLDGMVRMSEAYAKMALRDYVKKEDAQAIIDLLKRSLRDIGYDEENDQFDVDVMYSGISSSKRVRLNLILKKIKELQLANPGVALSFEDIYEPLTTEKGITEEFVRGALAQWLKDGELYQPQNDTWRLVNTPKQPKK
ncbi:MAG: LAGLIDADG family homing endonuclease [Promethearchaeota archaeon]